MAQFQVYHSNSAAWRLIFPVRPEIVHTIHHTYHVPSPPQYVHVHMPGPTVVKPVGLPRNYRPQRAVYHVLEEKPKNINFIGRFFKKKLMPNPKKDFELQTSPFFSCVSFPSFCFFFFL